MSGGKIKFRLDFLVAGKTEIGLFPLKQIFCNLNPMNLVAVITPYRTQFMDASAELEKILLLLMTPEAGIGAGFGISFFK
jgi:hypothetical protein